MTKQFLDIVILTSTSLTRSMEKDFPRRCLVWKLFRRIRNQIAAHAQKSAKCPLNRSQQSKVIYKACCWDCDDFYIGKTKRRLHDRKTEHFKALAKTDNTSAVADHVKTTGHNIKWDHFEILASGKTDYHCKIKETLFIQELKPAFNVNISSEKLMLYWLVVAFYRFTVKIVFS